MLTICGLENVHFCNASCFENACHCSWWCSVLPRRHTSTTCTPNVRHHSRHAFGPNGRLHPSNYCTTVHSLIICRLRCTILLSLPSSSVAIMNTPHLSCHLQRMTPFALDHLTESPCCRRLVASALGNSLRVYRVVPHRYVPSSNRAWARCTKVKKIVSEDMEVAAQVWRHQPHDDSVAEVQPSVLFCASVNLKTWCSTLYWRRTSPRVSRPTSLAS